MKKEQFDESVNRALYQASRNLELNETLRYLVGSAVCDVLSENYPVKVLKIGVNDVFGESGPALELIKKYELDADSIYKKVKAFVS